MAQLYTTGPCHFYVGPLAAPVYLGTAEESPDLQLFPTYKEVQNSIGGVGIPFDRAYQGEFAVCVANLNRFNAPVYQAMANRPGTFLKNTALGTNTIGDIGSLMLTEGLAYAVWLLFSFGAFGPAPKPVMVSNGMLPGYRFFAGMLLGPDKLAPLGTLPKKLGLSFGFLRVFNPAQGTFSLYDNNVAGLPPIN